MTGSGVGSGVTPVYAAVLCAGLAAWLLSGQDRELRRVRLLFAGGGSAAPGRDGLSRQWGRLSAGASRWWRAQPPGRLGRELWCLPAGGAVALLGDSLLPLLGAVAAVPLARRWLQRRERRTTRDRTAAQVIEVCAAVAGELRAGRQPNEALQAAVAGALGPSEASVLAAARFGGDVPGALRQAAGQPGGEGLLGMAACWQVAADGGAGLAGGLERVAAALRAEREQGEELYAQLAGTRSTAAMLALLPVFGLLMGSALGAEPLRVLLHTPPGWACLAVGGLLECAGLAWTARIIRSAVGKRRARAA
ncbi:type II secretion system F family protein [Streptomyces sp. NPDC004647]|uniref:type II secretion system F family protein n=1 Tax=Streptomyces sp. NPDC004647 TaxID=3154671 RepID=UPI0033B54547